MYINVTSSLLDWNKDGEALKPYHWMKIGSTKENYSYEPPKEKSATKDLQENIHILRAQRLGVVMKKYTGIFIDSEVKLNYINQKIVIISDWMDKIAKEDGIALSRNESSFNNGDLDISQETAKAFCRFATEDHHCKWCQEKAKVDTD